MTNAINLSTDTYQEYKQIIRELSEFLEQANKVKDSHRKTARLTYHGYCGSQALSAAKLDLSFFKTAIKNYNRERKGYRNSLPKQLMPAKKLVSRLCNQGVSYEEIAEWAGCTYQDVQIINNNMRPHPALVRKGAEIARRLEEFEQRKITV